MTNVFKTIGNGVVKYVLKNPFLMTGLGLEGACLVTAKLADKGKIKFKDKNKQEIFLMGIGGASSFAGALTALGICGAIGKYKADTSVGNIKVFGSEDSVCVKTWLSKMPKSSTILAVYNKETALELAKGITEAANLIKEV